MQGVFVTCVVQKFMLFIEILFQCFELGIVVRMHENTREYSNNLKVISVADSSQVIVFITKAERLSISSYQCCVMLHLGNIFIARATSGFGSWQLH